MTDLSGLFQPVRIGGLTLPNRIVFPAMGLSICADGVPGEQAAAYYARRASGGAGLVMTEGVYIDHPSSGDNPMLGRFHGDAALAAWGRVADAVHAAGGLAMPELWHVGLIYSGKDLMEGRPQYRPELGQVSPSGYIAPGVKVCEGMTAREIDTVIDAYARGAEQAVALGFDGVELHGGHGYLIDQFLWAQTNHRRDDFGGSPRARGRFVAEVVREIRRRLGPELPIVLRISQWKMVDYAARIADTPEELEQLLAPAVEAGVDMFDCSQRRFWEPAFAAGGPNLAGWVKRVTGVPSMTIGSVGLDADFMASLAEGRAAGCDLARLEELAGRLRQGEFDLVGVGRAMLAEPDWPSLVRAGQLQRLKPFTPDIMAELAALLPAREGA
ncbi:12-oxophytodienoate reductase [Mangrovimicrobium sediminis]|uniref:12-oxophytodienoate reductase n=1 Tax=Mangrovimicrobium sediminis TaxID=2562682 RepID=A0A4Z0LUI3_9GAMM|nr:12-oxophytodienoate reductase [Haliea sp. SAOS-164]TGD71073.1 12-oxophytodienoate reductase [Haliea sp. SAOS-164]